MDINKFKRERVEVTDHEWTPSGAPGQCGYVNPSALGTVDECGRQILEHTKNADYLRMQQANKLIAEDPRVDDLIRQIQELKEQVEECLQWSHIHENGLPQPLIESS